MPHYVRVLEASKSHRGGVYGLAIALAAVALVFLGNLPRRLDPDTPLPCDQAQPLLEALSFQSALSHLSWRSLADCLFAPDLYPPGHSILLGLWLTLGGSGPASLQLFKLATLCGCLVALWLCGKSLDARDQTPFLIGATAVLLLTVPLVVLSGTFLLEVPATGLALLAMATLAEWRQDSRHARRVLAAGLAIGATILTKYNIGLPLVPAALGLGIRHLIAGSRRRGLGQVAAAGIGLSLLALFLALQVDGWRNGFAFAANRANSEGASPAFRVAWYAKLYVEKFFAHPALALAALALACGAVCSRIRRSPLVIAAAIYVAATMGALALHPYLLDRSIVAASGILASLAGVGLATVARPLDGGRRAVRLAVTATGFVLLLTMAWTSRPAVLAGRAPYDDPALARLAPLSAYVRTAFARVESCRILGTFNEFGPGWAQLLWRQAHPLAPRELACDFAYPLPAVRAGLDDRDDPAYAAQVGTWAAGDPEEGLVTITVEEGSTWDNHDYRLWNRWKRNTIAATLALPGYAMVDEIRLDEEAIHVRFLHRPPAPVSFGAGWGLAEGWGRWALAREAVLTLRPPVQPTNLVLVAAAYEGLPCPQECELRFADGSVHRFTVAGDAWQWRTIEVPVPSDTPGGTMEATLRFGGVYPAFRGDLLRRALPFAEVRLDPRPR